MQAHALSSAQRFYHGTDREAAWSIARQGFKEWQLEFWESDDGDTELARLPSTGNLGVGIYVSNAWQVAAMYGSVILAVTLRPGLRILDASATESPETIEYLQREFGREIVERPPWKVLPKNKRLTEREAIALFLYHYWRAWRCRELDAFNHRDYSNRRKHVLLSRDIVKVLRRYGYGAYGEASDEQGLVVFSGNDVLLEELAFEYPGSNGRFWSDPPSAPLRAALQRGSEPLVSS